MTEEEIANTFSTCFEQNKKQLDLDYLKKFINLAINRMDRKYGGSEIRLVILDDKENQNVSNDLRWILEIGALMNIFQFKLESNEYDITQKQLVAILYEMNKLIAKEFVIKKILPSNCNILFSYSELSEIFSGSQDVYMKFCYDYSSKKLKENAKSNLYANYFEVMSNLLV
jgi:hypothetical protein